MIIKPTNKVNSRLSYSQIIECYKKLFLSNQFIEKNFGNDFVLHDGPPYANGLLHIGHIFNKTIKDIILRYKITRGYKVSIILGWDCHGLPIEKNVQQQLEDQNIQLNSVTEFRKVCAVYADKFIQIQKEEAKKYFFLQESQYYTTKSKEYTVNVIETLFYFNQVGQISKENMPVYYSFEEETNLAFSEIEYKDIEHHAIYFMVKLSNPKFKLLIYTTQPWTILGNEIICINKNIEYVSFPYQCFNIITSKKFAKQHNIIDCAQINAEWIVQQKYNLSPLCKKTKYIFHHDSVDDSGTGILHCAPAHGYEDYQIFKKYFPLQKVKNCINKKGFLINEQLKDFSITDKNKSADIIVIQILVKNSNMYLQTKINHRYPVSWRSKLPVYIRCDEQIILNITKQDIEAVKKHVSKSNWYGHEGLQTFLMTLSQRGLNWCISRQRKWGTPCMLFYDKVSNQIINHDVANNKIIELIKQHGEDFWFDQKYTDAIIKEFFDSPNILPILDTLDVWFDSGCSHLIINKRADMICEGRDQHRGWFQTYALITTMLDKKQFAQNIIVHGFTNINQGTKISKSNKLTHKISNQIINTNSDIIRIVTMSCNYGKDVVFDDKVLEQGKIIHLKLYNVGRYYINMADYHLKKNAIIYDLVNCHLIKKSQYEYSQYLNSMEQNVLQIAFKSIINISNILSEYIRVNKYTMYCTNPQSNTYQETMTCLQYISKLFYKSAYPVIPATIIYILTHLNYIKSEDDIIQFIQKPQIQLKEYDNDKSIVQDIKSLFTKLNIFIESQKQSSTSNIKQTQDIGILINIKYKYIFEYIQKYCQISYIGSLEESKKYTNIQIETIKTDEYNECIVLNLKQIFSKCTRCWRYYESIIKTMCENCHKHVKDIHKST